MPPRLRNKEEQKFTNNQLLEEVAINLQKIPFELQRKESLKTFILSNEFDSSSLKNPHSSDRPDLPMRHPISMPHRLCVGPLRLNFTVNSCLV